MADLLTLLKSDGYVRGAVHAPLNVNLVVIGDSIPAGYATSGVAWPTLLGLPASCVVNNTYAIAGHEAGGIVADLPSDGFYGLYQPGKTNIAVFQRGTNDIGNSNQRTGAATYAFTAARIADAAAAGFFTAVCTLLPRANGTFAWTAANETERGNYNAAVLANTAGADQVIDFAADVVMGPSSTPGNTALFADKLHPTKPGQDRLAAVVRAALLATTALTPKLPTLRTLTLARTTATAGSAFSVTISANSQAGSSFSATSSDGTVLTVTEVGTAANVVGTFSAAGTPTVTITETPFDGSAAKVTQIIVTVSAGTAKNFLRLTSLNSLTETAHSGGGYDYVAATAPTQAGYQTVQAGYSAAKLPANTDGWFGVVMAGMGPNGPIVGFSASATPATFNDCAMLIYADTNTNVSGNTGANYTVASPAGTLIAGASLTNQVKVEAGDIMRARRAGGTGYLEVSKDGGSTYTVVYSATITTAQLTPFVQTGTQAATGKITTPLCSTSVA